MVRRPLCECRTPSTPRHTMLTVAEDEHDGGVDREYGLMCKDPAGPWRRTRVVQRVARQAQLAYAATVRLDGERAGELPAAMSTRYKGLVVAGERNGNPQPARQSEPTTSAGSRSTCASSRQVNDAGAVARV